MEHFCCEENDAFKMFYESHTGKCYADDSTGLYGQSAVYVFSLFCEEQEADTLTEQRLYLCSAKSNEGEP